jgi:hypothetical protein
MYVYTFVCLYICKHTYIHIYIHTYTHTYIHAYGHTHIHTYIHIYIHHVQYIRHIQYIHTYIHIHIYIHITLMHTYTTPTGTWIIPDTYWYHRHLKTSPAPTSPNQVIAFEIFCMFVCIDCAFVHRDDMRLHCLFLSVLACYSNLNRLIAQVVSSLTPPLFVLMVFATLMVSYSFYDQRLYD